MYINFFQYGLGFLLSEYGRRRGAHLQFVSMSVGTRTQSSNTHALLREKSRRAIHDKWIESMCLVFFLFHQLSLF